MIYTPNKDNKKTAVVFSVGLIILLLLFVLTHVGIIRQGVCQLTFFFEAIYYTYILNKFVLPVYTYSIFDNSFVIVKTMGEKRITECNIELDKIIKVIPYKQYKKQEKTDVKSVYNYCANITASSCYCLLFEYYNSLECVMFEPNEEMVENINSLMNDRTKNQ